jgi:hypothetical protein
MLASKRVIRIADVASGHCPVSVRLAGVLIGVVVLGGRGTCNQQHSGTEHEHAREAFHDIHLSC